MEGYFLQTVGIHLTVGRKEYFYPLLDDYLRFAKNNPLLLQCLRRSYEGKLSQVF